jgi:hypothetical protein
MDQPEIDPELQAFLDAELVAPRANPEVQKGSMADRLVSEFRKWPVHLMIALRNWRVATQLGTNT